MPKDINKAIRRAIESSGISLTRLADRMGVSRSTIYNWKNGEVDVPDQKLVKLGHVLAFDFSSYRPSLKDRKENEDQPDVRLSDQLNKCMTEKNTLQIKYIALLEKYNSVLEENARLRDG